MEIVGGWYTDGRPDGRRVTLVKESHIDTDKGPIPLPKEYGVGAKQNLIWLRVAKQGDKFAGIGISDNLAWEWTPEGGYKSYGLAWGPRAVIYDAEDKLQVIAPPGPASGYQFVNDDNLIVSAEQARVDIERAVWEYTTHGDVTVGQGGDDPDTAINDDPVIVITPDGVRRRLAEGRCRAINYNRDGDKHAITWSREDRNSAFFEILTTAELMQLAADTPEAPKEEEDKPVIPKITVKDYAEEIAAGKEAQLFDLQVGDTHIVIDKDAEDNLHIRAENAAGEDHTGATRHVRIIGAEAPKPEPIPEPEPPPPPVKSLDRVWFGPNIASDDEVDLFTQPQLWAEARKHVGVFSFYVQNIMSGGPIGRNTFERLNAAKAFEKLRQWGIKLSIECGAVKPGDCEAKGRLNEVTNAIKRVKDAGGEVAFVSMDEPLTGSKQAIGVPTACNNTVDKNADATAAFIKAVEVQGPKVGWIEAWPEIDLSIQKDFLAKLHQRGALPAFWHLDIDWHRAQREGKSVPAMIREAREVAHSYGIPLGVMLAGYPQPNDAAYVSDVKWMADTLYGVSPDIHHVVVQSWAMTGSLQTQPKNLPETLPSTHTALVTAVAKQFEQTAAGPVGDTPAPPKPEPHPIPEPEVPNLWDTLNGIEVSFTTADGVHVITTDQGKDGLVMADRTSVGPWEQHKVIRLDGDIVAVLARNNRFWTAEGGEGGVVIANRPYVSLDQLGPWEKWRVVPAGDGRIALQPIESKLFFSPQQAGGNNVAVIGPAIGPWEPLTTSQSLLGVTPDPVVKLSIQNEMFVKPDGTVFPWRGVTTFLLFKRWLEGDKDGVRAYMQWAASTGFNVLRVFSQVDWAATSSNGAGFLASQYANYDAELHTFMAEADHYGLYVELVAHTFDYDLGQMAEHTKRLDDILSIHRNAFLEVSNEPQVTHIDIAALLARYRPSKTIWASGAYYPTAEPGGMYVTAHTKRDSEWPRKAKDLHEYRKGKGPYNATDPEMARPIVADEPMGAGEVGVIYDHQRATNPSDFYAYAALSQQMGAGGTYHYDDGLRALIPTGNQLLCAKAFAAGLRAVPPVTQGWSYTRSGGTGSPVTADVSLRTYVKMDASKAYVVRVRATGNYSIAPGWREVSRDQYGIVIELVRE